MNTQQQQLGQQDRYFIDRAARSGTAEIKLSQLVADHGMSNEVKQLGQHMIHDHMEANQELIRLASGKGMTPSEELDQEHRALMNRLSKLSGDEFDSEYIHALVDDHLRVIAEFEYEARQGQDEDLKNWASNFLPKLQQHLHRAQDIATRH